MWVAFHKAIGGMGAGAWVLVLLGPLGWLALAILSAFGTGRETLSLQLPYSEEAWARYQDRKRTRLWAIVAMFAISFGLWANVLPSQIMLGGLAMAAAVALITHVLLATSEVDVTMDASRRWVTLRGVHPDFAAAVDAIPYATQSEN
jgi:hypothetical protein